MGTAASQGGEAGFAIAEERLRKAGAPRVRGQVKLVKLVLFDGTETKGPPNFARGSEEVTKSGDAGQEAVERSVGKQAFRHEARVSLAPAIVPKLCEGSEIGPLCRANRDVGQGETSIW